jgi:hypothetical protein
MKRVILPKKLGQSSQHQGQMRMLPVFVSAIMQQNTVEHWQNYNKPQLIYTYMKRVDDRWFCRTHILNMGVAKAVC